MSRGTIALLALMLLVGLGVGFFLGRLHLESQWSQPLVELAPRPATSGEGVAIPPGTRALRPMPLRRSREALAQLSQQDPLRVAVGSVGRDDDRIEINLIVENRGNCLVNRLRGLAYGFDAWGAPSALRADGAHVLAFEADETIPPGTSARLTFQIAHAENASIALARVDTSSCAPVAP